MFEFDHWPLVQGQTRVVKLKSPYNSFIIATSGSGGGGGLIDYEMPNGLV